MNATKQPSPENGHFIVAIGASAGGLEAIHEFFDNMPSNGNLSFVIIQHLSPDYKSLLVELISKHTRMQVYEAQHGIKAEKNCVYVIPNNKLLTIRDGQLQLGVKNFDKAPNTAIDTFLSSLAEDQGSNAIAIILSGTGTDGSKGIQFIQRNGGMVLVQDPVTAKFDGMPNSAIGTGCADFILAPELMPEELFNYIKERPVRIAIDGRPDETDLPEVLKLIEKSCQYDFYNYKTATILRRVSRRMGMLGYKRFGEYLQLLRNSSDECRFLGKEFLIGVTKFFRDSAAFQLLRDEVLPDLIRSKEDHDILKIWVAACSTGEEAYSMAMLVDDVLQRMGRILEVKIFATDVDMDSVEFASKATYPAASVQEIDEHLVRRYFTKEGSQMVVQPRIRKQIVFARHNILKDPPFIKNDLVSCRNMLIYMNNLLQRKVFSTLQFALNTGGYLFLGPSETPASIKDDFEEVNGKWKIFRKITSDSRYNPERIPVSSGIRAPRETKPLPGKESDTQELLLEDFRQLLTEEYGFAAIYIDRNFDVREAVGNFRKYLSLPDKISSLNILRMVGQEVAVALNAAIRKAVKENKKVSLNQVRIGNEEKKVNLFVKPASSDGFMLIVISEGQEAIFTRHLPEFSPNHSPESTSYIAELEDELKETRTSLQMAIESMETANEELQSSNEELLSANEELQSSNEELQSLNEELHTLNTEHQLRIRELIELNDDLNNYFRSSEVAQIFVDSEMRIRRFNPVAVRMINLIESDMGRPIEHISTNLRNYDDFIQDIGKVIENKTVLEREVTLTNDTVNLMKIHPYLRQDKKVDGVVITFIDITNVRQLDNIITGVFNASLSAIMAFRAVYGEGGVIADFHWIASNHAADSLLKRAISDSGSTRETFPSSLHNGLFGYCVQVMESGKPFHGELQLGEAGQSDWYEAVINLMPAGVVINLTNINDKKKAETKFRQNYHELMKVKENYRNLNLELEQKVTERTNALSQSEERFRLIANTTSDAIWDWDLVNNSIWWSDSFYNRFGYDSSKVDSSSDFWLSHIHPEDREAVSSAIFGVINSGQRTWSARYRYQRADGSYAVIFDKGTVLHDANGMPYRMVGAMMDITVSEAAEKALVAKNEELESLFQEFKFVTDFMPQMVWSTNPDGHHDFYNKGWYDFTGLSFEESRNDGWSSVLHPEDQAHTWAAWNESLTTGRSYETEYRMRRHDGVYRWFLARAVPLRDSDGNVVKWFGTCTDIHDQRLMNDILELKVKERTEELQRINLELEASNNELLQFASVASHDLKEPLRKIHMFSNLIKDRFLSDPDHGASDYMNRIIAASARMTKLINDLLTFTRLSVSGSFELTDLNVIIDEVLSDLELAIQDKAATIEVQDLPEAEIITGQMRQVFQNLISNALKFTRRDKAPHVQIQCVRIGYCSFDAPEIKDGPFCRITIRDNGIGFDNQYADKIFTIFQRLHARDKYEGTGIGLAITRKIVEKHNGLIMASSREGDGACFTIILPLKQLEEPQHVLAMPRENRVTSN
jgi:two-component system CheB/CheR fusion protein